MCFDREISNRLRGVSCMASPEIVLEDCREKLPVQATPPGQVTGIEP